MASNAANLASFISGDTLNVNNSNDRVGIGSTVPTTALDVDGTVTATAFVGDGTNITNAGSTLNDASGTQRVVVTSQTSGSMTQVGTTGDLTYDSTTNTLSAENISIGGTLTYEDVTNVDSVGIITARSGIVVSSGATITVGSGVTISSTNGITLDQGTNASHIVNPLLINFAEKVNNLGNIGAGTTIDVADGTYVTATLNQDAPTITLASPPSGKLYGFALQLTNGSGGPYSLTFSGSGTIKWPGGSIPVRTTTDAKTDIWSFFTSDGGSNWYGSISLYNFS